MSIAKQKASPHSPFRTAALPEGRGAAFAICSGFGGGPASLAGSSESFMPFRTLFLPPTATTSRREANLYITKN